MASRTHTGVASREPLGTERVLRAALALADAGGAQALTNAPARPGLGVEAMSLYKHVTNKDAILDGILDLVVAEIALPSAGDGWKPAMRRRGISAHQVLPRHPWACMLLMSRINLGPAMLRTWTPHSAPCGRRASRSNWPTTPGTPWTATSTAIRSSSSTTELTVHVMGGHYDGVPEFTFGLGLVLDGLERLLAAPRPRPPGPDEQTPDP
jgi:AcrR family transcriptional regulator